MGRSEALDAPEDAACREETKLEDRRAFSRSCASEGGRAFITDALDSTGMAYIDSKEEGKEGFDCVGAIVSKSEVKL